MNAAEEYNVIPLPVNESKPTQTITPLSTQEIAGAGNLEKVRDLLFGAQMRDYDRRFVRLEERLVKEVSDAREDSRRRFDQLENFIRQEIASLGDRLRSENQQRTQAAEDITRELRDTSKTLNQKLHQFDEQTAQTHREIRQQMLDQSKNLSDEIRQKYEELAAALTREARELRSDKADRVALSNLFTELAMRLNDEFKLPGEE
jgi:DNA anti-recombination protein RmuC